MQIKYVMNPAAKPPGFLRKLVALVVMVALIALVLMFSAVLFVIILVVGTIAWAYLWWKTRELRKHMRDFQAQARTRAEPASNDEVFEGEVIRVVDSEKEK
jgi:sensor histidine kinase YesM